MAKYKEVDINKCYHYLGYRYGGYRNNLYEDFICDHYSGTNESKIKNQFIDRICGTRTTDFGQALGIKLTKKYHKWDFPWNWSLKRNVSQHKYTPYNNPDIVCHTAEQGVLASHINREFQWLIGAINNIKNGYFPEKYGYITLLELINKNDSHYIVLDGNHRISAMTALGYKKFLAKIVHKRVNLGMRCLWGGVILGSYYLDDATRIFERYFFEENLEINENTNRNKIILDEPLCL